MAETKLVLNRRVPDERRLAWAKAIVDRMGNRDIPNSLPEVYAKEAIILHDEPRRKLKLQAIRIGDLGIAAIPNEVFAITGLKIKASSPFETTMNIELANGSEGYIPPPEQHALGGYTTWPARTAGLEVQAEPKIVEAALSLLEQVAGKRRRVATLPHSRYARSVIASKPLAYWRADETQGPAAVDSSGHAHHARYQGAVAYYLPGPGAVDVSVGKSLNRSRVSCGGSTSVRAGKPAGFLQYRALVLERFAGRSPAKYRCAFMHRHDCVRSIKRPGGWHGWRTGYAWPPVLEGKGAAGSILAGKTEVMHKTWHHVALVHTDNHVTVYVDGNSNPDIERSGAINPVKGPCRLSIGGGNNGEAGFEGKIDEVAIYDRALAGKEIVEHFRAAQRND